MNDGYEPTEDEIAAKVARMRAEYKADTRSFDEMMDDVARRLARIALRDKHRNHRHNQLVTYHMTRISAAIARTLLFDNGWTLTDETDDTETWTFVTGRTAKSLTIPKTGWTELTVILS
jgi:hypothetical protein